MASLTQTISISHQTYLKIQIALDVFVASIVFTRLLTNFLNTRTFAVDDYVAIAAVAVLTSYSTCSFLIVRAFENPDTTISFITKLSVACLFTGGGSMYFAKAPILFFYIRIFSIKKWLRYACYILLTGTAIVYITCAIYSGVNCVPGNGVYDASFLARCENNTFAPALTRCFTSIFTDAVALSLPVAVVVKLHLTRSRKIALVVVFMSGIFAMIAGCISLYYQWRMARTGSFRDMTVAMLCTCIECSIAIIVGCAPTLHSLWTNYISKSRFVSSLRLLYPSQSRKSDTSSPSQHIKPDSHNYIELGDAKRAIPVNHLDLTTGSTTYDERSLQGGD